MRRGSVARSMAPVFGLAGALATIARAEARGPRPGPEPEGKVLTIDECVGIALAHNPDAVTADYSVADADAALAGVRGQFGPQLEANGNALEYFIPFKIPFGTQDFTVRNPFTWTVGATVTQPLTPLWTTLEQYKAQSFGVDVAAIKRTEARRQVAFDVTQSYYRLLESERLAEVAGASVAQLEAEEKQAQSNFTNGVIAKNDLLRAQLALANARQRSIQAAGAIVLARAQLAQSMGLPPAEAVEAVPFSGGAPPTIEEPSLATAEAHALARRPEVREIARSIDQAEASERYARTKLLPQLNAVANYTYTAGSQFVQTNAEYVGLMGSWNVWDWGTTESAISQASAKLSQARLARHKVEDQVRLEARQAFVNAGTARDALDVARVAVAQGEENFRIVTKRFENAAATSFDMVDAEALLTQARAQVETALYDFLIARAALERATGATLPGGD